MWLYILTPSPIMENSVKKQKAQKAMAFISKSAAAVGAALFGISAVGATDYNMAGPALDATVVTGMKAGVGDSIHTIQTTLNNQYLTELAVMFIGFAVVVGLVMHFMKGHRRI